MSFRDENGRLIFELPSGTSYRLIDDIDDEQIVSKGDGSFHPANVDWVIDALSTIDVAGASMGMPVNVYVLPFPRSGFLTSSACGNDVFLSPGVYEINRYAVAFTVTHEIGHVFQHRFVPESEEEKWPAYLKLRGIYNDPLYENDSPRMSRPVEIFAEDFRYLFGGVESRSSGRIENPNLRTPDAVSGLKDFFVTLIAPEGFVSVAPSGACPFSLSNYPNPFNPSTTVRVVFADDRGAASREIDVSIYRVDGSLVRNLYHGTVSNNEFSTRWDGRDDRGSEASSGIYLYAVRAGGKAVTGKMLLLK